MPRKTLLNSFALAFGLSGLCTLAATDCALAAPPAEPASDAEVAAPPPIPVRFKLARAGDVTLVIEDGAGNRVRNLVSGVPFPAGENVVWWDGRDESIRVPHVEGNRVGVHGIYRAMGRPVAPGTYRVRGLVRDPIRLKYDLTVYPNVGNPPWRTADGLGAWLSDHNPPVDTEFVPALEGLTTEPRVYISAPVAEAGFGLIWTDLTGKKLGGVRWIGGHWTGATYLARDAGAAAHRDIILYTGSSFRNDKDKKTGEVRLNVMVAPGAREVLKWTPTLPPGSEDSFRLTGLAAHNGLLVAAEAASGQLLFVQVAATPPKGSAPRGSLLGTASLAGVRDLAFDSRGNLLVLQSNGVRRITLPPTLRGEVELEPGSPWATGGLQDAQRMTLLQDGGVAITDGGTSHQVKLFDAAGKPGRVIGSGGVPGSGPYNKLSLGWPKGLTQTPGGELWVAEYNLAPKRVSIWQRDGKLVRDMIGPPAYGGGGWLDSRDKSRFYLYHGHSTQGGGMEFQVNWEAGKAELVNVYLRSDAKSDFGTLFNGDGPDCAVYFQDQKFLTNAWSSNPTGGARILGLWSMKDKLAAPAMAAGNTHALPAGLVERLGEALPLGGRPQPLNPRPAPGTNLPYGFIWTDENGNGRMDVPEWKFFPLPAAFRSVAPDSAGNLVFTLQDRVLSLPLRMQAGLPGYEVEQARTLAQGFTMQVSSGGAQSVVGRDNWTVVTNGPVEGFLNGQKKWYYHNQWPGLHAGHRAPAKLEYPGQLVAVTRLLGLPITPHQGEGGEIWGVNSDKAVMYLFTTDGLFVGQLGNIDTAKQWRDPAMNRGLDVSDVNFIGENFWPTLNQTPDGQILLGSGKEHSSLIRVEGLESIKRIAPQELQVTSELLGRAAIWEAETSLQKMRAQQKGPLQVALRPELPVKVDGKLTEWDKNEWVVVEGPSGTGSRAQRNLPIVEAALTVSGDHLYVGLRSKYLDLLRNAGQEPQELFKTGGGLDLMLRSNAAASSSATVVAGDKRLIVALGPDGKKVLAALFEPVVPGTRAEAKVPFSSPWRTITLDRVQDVAAQIRVAVGSVVEKDKDGENMRVENAEVAIPLSLLNIQPAAGQTLRGDVGVLRGQGGETTQRIYWSNKATGLISDVPGEAMLHPAGWGEWQFVAGELRR